MCMALTLALALNLLCHGGLGSFELKQKRRALHQVGHVPGVGVECRHGGSVEDLAARDGYARLQHQRYGG